LNVVSFYGPMLIGVFVSCILYGIFVLQTWNYFQSYIRDGRALKLFVFYLLLVETVETLLAMGVVFEPLIVEYAQPPPKGTTGLPFLLPSQALMAVLVSAPVQLFTAWRIYIITESYWMPGIASAFALASFGSSFYTTERIARARDIAHKAKLTHPWFLLFAAATDIITTTTLIYSLSRKRSHDRSTNVVLGKIMKLALQTGMITTIFTLADAIAIYVSPQTAISFAFDFPVPKLYSNALLSTLNARSRLSRMVQLDSDELSTFRIQARNSGLFDLEGDDDNPLFGRERGPSSRESGNATSSRKKSSGHQKAISSGGPITFTTSALSDSNSEERGDDLEQIPSRSRQR